MFPVEDRRRETLLPIVLEHVEPGAVVISDKAPAYITNHNRSHLQPHSLDHYFINHSLDFVDPVQPWIHTNTIERQWRSLRTSIGTIRRKLTPEQVTLFLDTFIFFNYIKAEEFYETFLHEFV